MTGMKNIFFVFVAQACALILYAQGSMQLGAGTHVKSSAGAYIVLDNINIVNNGTLQQIAGNGFIKLTGATTVSLSGSSNTVIDALLMAKSTGSTFNLNSNLSIVSNVNFSGGLLNLNNSILNLGSTGIFINESELGRAFTTGSGYIEASGILNAPSSVDLGHLGAVITSLTNMGNTIIRRGHAIQTGVPGSNNSIRRYYDIIPMNNMNLKAVLQFYYFDAELNAIPETSLYQWKSKDNINWDFVGADARDIAANYVEKKSINKFDRWTLAAATAPTITCPGNITTNANQSGCKALVSFAATATGVPAPTVTYRIGNAVITSPHVFSKGTTTVTATASNGILPDALCTFTVTVVCGQVSPITTNSVPQQEFQVIRTGLNAIAYPNPSANDFSVTVQADPKEKIIMQVVDMYGRVIETRNVNANSPIRFGDRYNPGTYFVRIVQGKEHKEIKLVKLSD